MYDCRWEWGNPIESIDTFDAMLNYSPYDNVKSNATLPTVYISTGLHDARVKAYEPVKFIAKLRHHHGNKPSSMDMQDCYQSFNSSSILLRVTNFGHFVSGTLETAEVYTILLLSLPSST